MQAALFDLDGVVFDTEPQYSVFWGAECRRYHPEIPNLASRIKGQTLVQIYDRWFGGKLMDEQPAITRRLNDFESRMSFDYVAGFENFVKSLREKGIKTAVVTSSNMVKMEIVYRKHPEFKGLFDAILTSEDFRESKPSPDCYLKAAERLGADICNCVVFEDSINGLRAGRDSGAYVVALATTNPAYVIAPLADEVVRDYENMYRKS